VLNPARLLACVIPASPSAWAALPFAVAPVKYQMADTGYSTEATVEAVKQSTIAAQVAGRVTAVNFDAGDYVKAGAVIVRLSAQELSSAVAGSQAQVAQAEADAGQRPRQLSAPAAAVPAEIHQPGRARPRHGRVPRRRGGRTRGARRRRPDRRGEQLHRDHRAVFRRGRRPPRGSGRNRRPGTPLMTGFDPKDMRVIANVPQYKLAEVKAAPRVAVEIPSLNKWIDAAGVTVLPSADAATHTVKVRIDLPTNLEGVIPGMFARAHFSVGSARKLTIPSSAVVRRSEITAVYVVREG
jgi:multidrug efflux pump subunit AcrA (membrane-fusion protein)